MSVGGVSSPERHLHLPVKNLPGLLTLGPGEAPLTEASFAPELTCNRLHLLKMSIWDWWVLAVVLFQAANHSLAFVWQRALLHTYFS